jgi:aspartate aminotransferase-like enzyme
MIHHRTPKFERILDESLSKLKKIFLTENPCFALTSTGSGGMEALLINVLAPNARVLCVNSGKFGERWGQMAEIFGAQVTYLNVPWGEATPLDAFEDQLAQNPFDIILSQACETSTGVLHPIKKMSQIIRQKSPKTLFLVDAITALGATELPMDEWDIDGIVGGSQKAFMLPTGLSLISFSNRAWKVIEDNPTPRFYFDIRLEKKANLSGQTYYSSNVTLIRALNLSLDLILEKGLNHHLKTIKTIFQFTQEAAQAMGIKSYSQSPSPSISALRTPVDSQKLRDLLEEKFHLVVMGGQDQAKGKIIRIGHMGYLTKSDIIQSWDRITMGLHELGYKIPSPEKLNEIKKQFSMLPELYS